MKDVQNFHDERGIAIQRVGVRDCHLPFLIKMKNGKFQSVLADIQLTVDLPHQFKGTHMSRFIEVLNQWSQQPISNKEIQSILTDIRERTGAKRAHIDVKFKYFLEKIAPVSGLSGLLDYNCLFSGELNEQEYKFALGVTVPVTSLCPCSKEISDFSAHNQRSEIKVKVHFCSGTFLWIEELIKIMELQGSAQVYSLLKREDEKLVTEFAYDNAKFVEDIIRDSVLALRANDKISWFDIECVNFESIHNHNAYARHSETNQKSE